MSTANVARDIIEIFERHGQWREKEATRLLSSRVRRAKQYIMGDAMEHLRYRPDQETVQYWGFSYGQLH